VTFVEGSDDRVAEFERVFDLATPVSPAVAARR
jgi:hypothetical protein